MQCVALLSDLQYVFSLLFDPAPAEGFWMLHTLHPVLSLAAHVR